MPKIFILYYSRTGNTEKMAEAVAQGAGATQEVETEMKFHATPEELANAHAIIIGVPTYHHDMTVDIKDLLEKTALKNINLRDKIGVIPVVVIGVGKNVYEYIRGLQSPAGHIPICVTALGAGIKVRGVQQNDVAGSRAVQNI